MAAARTNFRTAKGKAVYPWLNQPDTKFHKPDGIYKCGLRLSTDEAHEIMQAATVLANEALGKKAENARMPWDTEADTGEIVFKTKSKYKPKFHDSKGSVIPEDQVPRMFGGSVLKLKGTMTAYDTGANWGITMNLTGVQVIDPVTQGQDGEGFDAVEDGFIVSESDNFDSGVTGANNAEFNADF